MVSYSNDQIIAILYTPLGFLQYRGQNTPAIVLVSVGYPLNPYAQLKRRAHKDYIRAFFAAPLPARLMVWRRASLYTYFMRGRARFDSFNRAARLIAHAQRRLRSMPRIYPKINSV